MPKPVVLARQALHWIFSTPPVITPGQCIDRLIGELMRVHPSQWVEGLQIWSASSDARRFSPKMIKRITELVLEHLHEKTTGGID